MSANPPEWAYRRADELHRAFTGSSQLLGLNHAYADMKGAFADYISRHEQPPLGPPTDSEWASALRMAIDALDDAGRIHMATELEAFLERYKGGDE